MNDPRAVSRVNASHASGGPDPLDIPNLVRHAVDVVVPLAAAREITLAIEETPGSEPVVRANWGHLSEILLAFLSSALTHTRPGGRVTVAYGWLGPLRYRIQVHDTGARASREKLQVLVTSSGPSAVAPEAGEEPFPDIAAARKLAEDMGGSLGVTRGGDFGTLFWVELSPGGERNP